MLAAIEAAATADADLIIASSPGCVATADRRTSQGTEMLSDFPPLGSSRGPILRGRSIDHQQGGSDVLEWHNYRGREMLLLHRCANRRAPSRMATFTTCQSREDAAQESPGSHGRGLFALGTYRGAFLGSSPTSAVDRNPPGDPITSVDGSTIDWPVTAIVGGAIDWPVVAAAIAVAIGRIAIAV